MLAAKETRLKKLLVKIRSAPHWQLNSLLEDGASMDDIRDLYRRGYLRTWWGKTGVGDPFAALDGSTSDAAAVLVSQLTFPNGPIFVRALKIENGPDTGRIASDIPDGRMYVELPADPKAYRPASEIQTEITKVRTMKRLVAIIENPDNNVRWTRPLGKNGRPMKNRRSIHLCDWRAYSKRCSASDTDGFTDQSTAEIEHRKAAFTQAKRARK